MMIVKMIWMLMLMVMLMAMIFDDGGDDDDAMFLKGDVLITVSTDIGWSPYFPLLGGVVTELGGLISHGAVVAREYGLPCVVAAAGATDVFETGDTILAAIPPDGTFKLTSVTNLRKKLRH